MASSSFLSAMDKHTPKQLGENGNPEYGWSHELKERIVQFYFQLVRCKNTEDSIELSLKLNDMIQKLKVSNREKSFKTVPEQFDLLRSLYKLIGHTRDIQNGKGEKTLAYMQIYTWYSHFPQLAKHAFRTMVHYVNKDNENDSSQHQYGSWYDVKYFCKYVYERSYNQDHELINYAVELMVEQLKKDMILQKAGKPFSLAARCMPKEKQAQYSWIFRKMASVMFPYTTTATTQTSFTKALNKSHMDMRNLVIKPLNKALDTTQIKMCGGRWSEIKWNNVTSKTLRNNTNAWQNVTKSGEVRCPTNEDRIQCAKNYAEHVEDAKVGKNGAKLHGRVMNTYELVKDAYYVEPENKTEIDRINLQWEDAGKKVKDNLGNVIAMADTSASMTSDKSIPFYNSLGLSIRVSEKANPAFQGRVLQFSSNANWFNFNGYETFYDKVQYMKPHINEASTNFVGAMRLILDAILEADLSPREVADLVLVVFSDMQINEANGYGAQFDNTMYDTIKEMCKHAGENSKYRSPFNPPHIVFWNLRKTNGFPTTSDVKNVTMISGYSDALLNNFLEKGVEALREYTGYSMFMDIVNHQNYDMLGHYFMEYFMPMK